MYVKEPEDTKSGPQAKVYNEGEFELIQPVDFLCEWWSTILDE